MPEIYTDNDINKELENRSNIQHEDPRGEFPKAEYKTFLSPRVCLKTIYFTALKRGEERIKKMITQRE